MCLSDSGSTDLLVRVSDVTAPNIVLHPDTSHSVYLPNGNHIDNVATVNLPISNRPDSKVMQGLVFPDHVLNQSLSATADYTNNGYPVIYTADGIYVLDPEANVPRFITDNAQHVVLKGHKSPTARSWSVAVPLHPEPSGFTLAQLDSLTLDKQPGLTSFSGAAFVSHNATIAQKTAFYSASLGNPPNSTFRHALLNNFLTGMLLHI